MVYACVHTQRNPKPTCFTADSPIFNWIPSFKKEIILQYKRAYSISSSTFLLLWPSLNTSTCVSILNFLSQLAEPLFRAGLLLQHNTETMAAAFLNVSTYIPDYCGPKAWTLLRIKGPVHPKMGGDRSLVMLKEKVFWVFQIHFQDCFTIKQHFCQCRTTEASSVQEKWMKDIKCCLLQSSLIVTNVKMDLLKEDFSRTV